MKKNKYKIYSIILARSGSTGLKQKNLLKIKNKSLFVWSILRSKKSKYISKTILFTDSKIYARLGKTSGAYIPYLRSKNISKSTSTSYQTINHLLKFLKKNHDLPDYFVLIEPTSPLTETKDIDRGIKKLLDNTNMDFLVSVAKLDKFDENYLYKVKKSKIIPVKKIKNNLNRSQNTKTYFLDGSIYIAKSDKYLQNKGFLSNKTLCDIYPKHKSFEIDDKIDYEIVKQIFKDYKIE